MLCKRPSLIFWGTMLYKWGLKLFINTPTFGGVLSSSHTTKSRLLPTIALPKTSPHSSEAFQVILPLDGRFCSLKLWVCSVVEDILHPYGWASHHPTVPNGTFRIPYGTFRMASSTQSLPYYDYMHPLSCHPAPSPGDSQSLSTHTPRTCDLFAVFIHVTLPVLSAPHWSLCWQGCDPHPVIKDPRYICPVRSLTASDLVPSDSSQYGQAAVPSLCAPLAEMLLSFQTWTPDIICDTFSDLLWPSLIRRKVLYC